MLHGGPGFFIPPYFPISYTPSTASYNASPSKSLPSDREFRKAGIVIAFPQSDVHLDTTEALDVRLVTGNTPQKGTDPGSGPDGD